MSIHTWVRRNLAAYVIGGLNATERARLERHVNGCPECACALDAARSRDGALAALFADVQPGPELENETIRRLRQTLPPPERRRLSRKVRIILAIAAALLLAAAGAGMSGLIEGERLRFPGEVADASGESRATAANNLKQQALAFRYHTHGTADHGQNHLPPGDMKRPEELALDTRKGLLAPSLALVMPGTSKVHTNLFGRSNGKDGASNDILVMDVNGSMSTGGKLGGEWNQSSRYSRSTNQTTLGFNSFANGDNSRFVESNVVKGKPGASGYYQGHPLDLKPGYFKPGDAYALLGPKTKEEQQAINEYKNRESRRIQELVKNGAVDGKVLADVTAQTEKQPKGEENANKQPEQGKPGKGKQPPEQATTFTARKIIRTGEIDFEVNSFDAASATITRLVAATKGGFIATVNSEKLANGKVRGSVVIRVPPEQLDNLVLALRKELGKTGELKGQRIGSQDITKQYTDLESRLKAARAMEERLLKIIREAKGQIKDLLQAEKELGVYRTRIEEMEGELRYYAHQVALSTLTVVLAEKEMRVAAAVTERERVQAGVEVEDVEIAMRELLKAVAEAQGRVLRSELKQHGAGQFNALMHFEVAPDKAGPVRDRMRQLGTVTRLEIDRVQQPENGGTLPVRDGKLRRGDTQILVSLYNLFNVGPRETVTLKLAVADVPAAYQTLREAVTKARGHVINSQLNEEDRLHITASLAFDVRRAEEAKVKGVLTQAGEILTRNVTRKGEGEKDKDKENLTDAKLQFNVELLPTAAIPPREIDTLAVEVHDVEATLAVLAAQVKEVGGTVIAPQIAQEQSGRVTARVIYRMPLTAASGVVAKVKSSGQVRVQKQDFNPKAPEGKLAVAVIEVTLSNVEMLVPSEQGLWAQIRHGLSVSLRGLAWSASWLIVGLLFVLPWLLLIYAFVWLVRRLFRGSAGHGSASSPPDAPATSA